MANTYTLIASSTVGSGGTSSIDFSSIPATYTDLQILWSLRTNNDPDAGNYGWLVIAFNGSTANLTRKTLLGSGSAASSSSATNAQTTIDGLNNTASTFANGSIYVPNYSGSANKSASIDNVMEQNGTTTYMSLNAILWSQTTAVNQLTLSALSGSFVQYSTAYLYGIKSS
jgi:hypothetical protein